MDLVNTTVSSWENISCLSDSTMNQSRFFIEYDVNNCREVSNFTYWEYRSITDASCSSGSSAGGGGGGGGGGCTSTCASLNFVCGMQTVCGVLKSCGNCTPGNSCVGGRCISNPLACMDTCESMNYSCGSHLICGNETDCGKCAVEIETPEKKSFPWWIFLFLLLLLLLLLGKNLKLALLKINIHNGKVESVDVACRKGKKLLNMGKINVDNEKMGTKLIEIKKKREKGEFVILNVAYKKLKKDSKSKAGFSLIKPWIRNANREKKVERVSSVEEIEKRFKRQEFWDSLLGIKKKKKIGEEN